MLKTSTKIPVRTPYWHLFFNHGDGWGSTLIISLIALILHNNLTPGTISLSLAMGLIYWWGFAVNDYFDAPFDAEEESKAAVNFFVQKSLPRWSLIAATVVVVCLVMLVFIQFGWNSLIALSIFLFGAWAYSAEPLRLKSKPGMDLLMHAGFVETFPYWVTLYIVGQTWETFDTVIVAVLFFSSIAAQLEQQSRDFEVDSLNDRNFTTTVGLKVNGIMLKVATISFCSIFVGAIILQILPLVLAPIGLIMTPIIYHRFFKEEEETRPDSLINISILLAASYVSILFVLSFLGTSLV